MLFSAWQATTHALQPVQIEVSMVIAHWSTIGAVGSEERGERAALVLR